MIIDSHCHLHDEKYQEDLNEVLCRAQDAKISYMISVGCDLATTKKAQELATRIDSVYFSAGYHPHEAQFLSDENLIKLKMLARDAKCVAIGECGLDFYYLHSSKEDQFIAFEKQIQLAKELSLPLIVHVRDAFEPCIGMLKLFPDVALKTVIHCFSGTLKEALDFVKLGCFISLSGIVTFKKPGELIEVAKNVPKELLLIETDSPYLAPHPFRGKRNEPSFISYTLDAIAKARNEEPVALANQLTKNTERLFGIGHAKAS